MFISPLCVGSSSACVRLVAMVHWTRRSSIGSWLHFFISSYIYLLPVWTGPLQLSCCDVSPHSRRAGVITVAAAQQWMWASFSPWCWLFFDVKASCFSSGPLFIVSFDICHDWLTSVLSLWRLRLLFSVCWHLLCVCVDVLSLPAAMCWHKLLKWVLIYVLNKNLYLSTTFKVLHNRS